ncbi:MAG TPA: ATPase, partial [Chromatiaceae bacterium]|nr:ATPase [Chromatiaceae bacterium]
MMTPVPMCRVSLSLLTEDLIQAGLELARFGSFSPQSGSRKERTLPEQPLREYLEIFESARMRFNKISQFLGFEPQPQAAPERAPDLTELQALNLWLEEIWQHCSAYAENLRRSEEELREVRQLQGLLRSYRHLDFDLGLLHADFRFLHVRLGTIPQQNLGRLREAVALSGFTLTRFAIREERAHIIVAGLKEKAKELETVLKAADFRGLQLPIEFSDHPARVEKSLAKREQRALQQQRHLKGE